MGARRKASASARLTVKAAPAPPTVRESGIPSGSRFCVASYSPLANGFLNRWHNLVARRRRSSEPGRHRVPKVIRAGPPGAVDRLGCYALRVGFLALVLPERWLTTALPTGFDPAALAPVRAERQRFCEAMRRTSPCEGSDDEARLLVRLVTIGLGMVRALGPAAFEVTRAGVNVGIKELLAREYATADTERKFALRQIEQALNSFGVLVEALVLEMAELPLRTVVCWLEEAAAQADRQELDLDAHSRVLLRFEADLIVALDSLDESLDDLTTWAFRAATGARKVEALPFPKVTPGLRGELARLRARRAWARWDSEEIQREFAPWQPSGQ